jgi:hypothetical protein
VRSAQLTVSCARRTSLRNCSFTGSGNGEEPRRRTAKVTLNRTILSLARTTIATTDKNSQGAQRQRQLPSTKRPRTCTERTEGAWMAHLAGQVPRRDRKSEDSLLEGRRRSVRRDSGITVACRWRSFREVSYPSPRTK